MATVPLTPEQLAQQARGLPVTLSAEQRAVLAQKQKQFNFIMGAVILGGSALAVTKWGAKGLIVPALFSIPFLAIGKWTV